MQECLESMEKVAAPTEATRSLFNRLLGNSSIMNPKSKQNVSAAEALKDLFNSGNEKVIKTFLNNSINSLKKKINTKELARAKKKALEGSDLAAETGKVLLEGKPGLGGATGAGALLGGTVGAFQDTDEENTNMLGVTQKKKGKFSDRLKNIATGAAIGAAGGAGLKAKSIAKKNIDQNAAAIAKGGVSGSVKNMSDDAILQKAFDSMPAGDYNGDLLQHLDKAYNQYVRGTGKQDVKGLKNALRTYLFDKAPLNIGGLDPNHSGALEKFFDLIRGKPAQRKATANDYTSAVYELLKAKKENGTDQARNFLKFMSGFDSNIDAWRSLYHNPNKSGMDEDTLNRISKIIYKLNDPSDVSLITKAFKTRKPLLWSPFRWDTFTTPMYRGNTRLGEPLVVGYSNDLANKLKSYISTKNAVDDIL